MKGRSPRQPRWRSQQDLFAATKDETQEDTDLQKQHQETVANLTATLETQRAAWLAAAANLATLKAKPARETPPEAPAKAEQEVGAAQAVLTELETQIGELSSGYGKATASSVRPGPFQRA